LKLTGALVELAYVPSTRIKSFVVRKGSRDAKKGEIEKRKIKLAADPIRA